MPHEVLADPSTVSVTALIDVDSGRIDRYRPNRPIRLFDDERGWEMNLEYIFISRETAHIMHTGKLVINMREGGETYQVPLTIKRVGNEWTLTVMVASTTA